MVVLMPSQLSLVLPRVAQLRNGFFLFRCCMNSSRRQWIQSSMEVFRPISALLRFLLQSRRLMRRWAPSLVSLRVFLPLVSLGRIVAECVVQHPEVQCCYERLIAGFHSSMPCTPPMPDVAASGDAKGHACHNGHCRMYRSHL